MSVIHGKHPLFTKFLIYTDLHVDQYTSTLQA